jgi:hypothetical protein
LLFIAQGAYSEEKFLRIRGELVDGISSEPITDYNIMQVIDEEDSTTTSFDGSKFEIWMPANCKSKIYFIKKGYLTKHILVDASFIPSIAYKKKQRIELSIKMKAIPENSRNKSMKKPIYTAEYVAKLNAFEVKDLAEKSNQKVHENYRPPFPSPADTYRNVKPNSNQLELTTSYNEKKAAGSSGISRVLQGILFADMNYCLFNERTNQANEYLRKLKKADDNTWSHVKEFDSPEYGRIVMRTLNREESIDTLFALGAYIETSRLIFQSFTSDSKVLMHLKKLKHVLAHFSTEGGDEEVDELMDFFDSIVPLILIVEKDYRDHLKNKANFEMSEDEKFVEIKAKMTEIYLDLIS